MKFYFDTSIINKILDDKKKDLILEKIINEDITAIPSLVNLCEILSTPDDTRKSELLNLYDVIRKDYHPLKPFPILLRDATLAIERNENEIKVNMPIKIDEETERLCKDALKDKGTFFDSYALKARDWILNELNIEQVPDAKSFFDISDDERMNPTWIKLFNTACDGLGIKNLNISSEKILEIIKTPINPWKYYFDSTLYIFYKRAISPKNYGRKKNPGGADLEQCVYLCLADLFVIRDGAFYNFLKELKSVRNLEKEIFDYDEFLEYFL